MTPEEAQRIIEAMLQVQRELQESQIRLQQEGNGLDLWIRVKHLSQTRNG